MVVGPAVERLADELAPVVGLDALGRLSALSTDPGDDLGDIAAPDRLIGVDGQALPAKIIDYR